MALKFFGRGSGFTDNHTSAYFSTPDNELVIIDCPVTALQKLMEMDLDSYENIYVLITHTHGDHVGGLGLFVQYAFFVLKKEITVVTPTNNVLEDISMLFKIEGISPWWCKLITDFKLTEKEWFAQSISTTHSPELIYKCYGYNLNIDGTNVVYTGDTSTLNPFVSYLTEGSILYVDTSVYYGRIHLKLENTLDDFIALSEKGIKVYLMHLDDPAAAEKIVAAYPNINVVTID